MSIAVLALALDTTPETLSRRLSTLKKRGLLLKKGRTIPLLDADALAEMLREE